MKQLIIGLTFLFTLTHCTDSSSEKNNGEIVSSIASGGEVDKKIIKENEEAIQAEADAEKKLMSSLTTYVFDKEFHDFGEIATGSENKCVFKVTNTGKNPLIIDDVSASCGCTTPKKPEKPIPPGKSDVIEVGFKPNGPGPSEKTVTVQANTEPRIQTVKVKANVK